MSTDGTTPTQRERAALCDLFVDVGPDAPTLSGEWTTRDLAAHLVIREGRPDAAIGLVVGRLGGYTGRVQAAAAEQPWERLVATVRSGPPRWSPMRIAPVDRAVNTIEFFVHHEDVRRATEPWTVRELDAALRADLRSSLGRIAKVFGRASSVGFELVAVDTDETEPLVAKRADQGVTVTGGIGELVLFMYGRGDHAELDFNGDAGSIEALRTTAFGI